ncbi:MAG: RCC1 repeat-containing protein [Chloroflexi bacterium]|nr:RCC1 repeat-containing protein [Chloroflexota bacterium]
MTSTGSTFCWGANDSGQLGDGTLTGRTLPVSVSSAATWTSVTAGSAHACAVTASSTFFAAGLAHCWGRNSSGQLGDGTTTVRTTPTAVSTTRRWTVVSAGGDHTCGLTATVSGTLEGTALCWGANGSGQLGDGTNSVRSVPTTVSTSLTLQGISAGYRHTCAVTASSTFSVAGLAKCWGLNANGQLGDGTTSDATLPMSVAGSITWSALVSGGASTGSHSCGLAQNGAAYCWGTNPVGQVGDASIASRNSPSLVTGSVKWQSISVGASHTCGITSGLAPSCWGKNESGQLGAGYSSVRPLPADIGGGFAWTTLSVGDLHSCGIVGSGAAYCWGDNASGQLGDGTTTSRTVPTRVLGGLTWKAISAGYAHTCGLTLSGIAYCWGANLEGQIGDGTIGAGNGRQAPTLVAGLLTWATVSAGTSHTCGTTTASVAYCWGWNGDGQLGDGNTTSRTAPVAVFPLSGQALSTWASVRAGGSHTCGVTSGTVAACWGANAYGQLGD